MPNKFYITCFLICQFCFAAAQQTEPMSFRLEAQSLISAFHQLEQQYGVVFAYDNALVDDMAIAGGQFENQQLGQVLQKLLGPLQLDFDWVSGNYLVIKERTPVLWLLRGRVIDSLSQEPLSFVNIQLKGRQQGTTTDENGRFQFQSSIQPNDSLLFSYVGFKKQCLPTSLFAKGNNPLIGLAPDQLIIPKIIIQDRSIELLQTAESGAGILFRPEKMGTLPGWGDNDILRMAQLLPGIHSNDESASNLHIRGGTPDQNRIYWDGIPIYHTGHFFGLLSAFNPYATSTIQIYRSGAGARFGGHTAGIIDITSKPEQLDSTTMTAGANLLNAHLNLSVPLWKGHSALLVAGRRSYSDLIESATYQQLFNQITSGGRIQDQQDIAADNAELNILVRPKLKFSDINSRWIIQPNKASRFYLSFYQGTDALDYDFGVDEPGFYLYSNDVIRLKNWGLSASWQQQWSSNFESQLQAFRTQYQHSYRYFVSLDRNKDFQYWFEQGNRMEDQSLKLDTRWTLNSNNALNFGMHYTFQEVAFNWQFIGIEEAVQQTDQRTMKGDIISFFLDYDLQNQDGISIDFGVRYDYFGPFDHQLWEPRLSFDYQPFVLPLHFKASLGRYVQFASQMLNTNELGLGEELWIMASAKDFIPYVISTEWTSGIWFEKRGWLVDLEYYSKRPLNLTTLNLRFENGDNPYALGQGILDGFDVLLKKKWRYYSSWISYAYGKVEYRFDSLNGGHPFPAAHDQRHTFNWTHLIQLEKWQFAISWQYASGRPYTHASGIEQYSDPNSGETSRSINYEGRNQHRLSPYHRLDLSAHYQFTFARKGRGKCGLSVFNIYNRRNIFDRRYLINETKVGNLQTPAYQLLSYDQQLLGITPNIFFELQW